MLLTPISYAAASNLWILAGWTDGTKFEIFELRDTPQIHVAQWSDFGSRNGDDTSINVPPISPFIWVGLFDDGTNVHWATSTDGVNFLDVYQVAKSGGYLSNYNTIFWGAFDSGNEPWGVTLRCYDINGLNARFPNQA